MRNLRSVRCIVCATTTFLADGDHYITVSGYDRTPDGAEMGMAGAMLLVWPTGDPTSGVLGKSFDRTLLSATDGMPYARCCLCRGQRGRSQVGRDFAGLHTARRHAGCAVTPPESTCTPVPCVPPPTARPDSCQMTGCCYSGQCHPPVAHPGLAEHATGLKTVTEALYLRDHVLERLETAEDLTDPGARRAASTFLVVAPATQRWN